VHRVPEAGHELPRSRAARDGRQRDGVPAGVVVRLAPVGPAPRPGTCRSPR
jgi:hypothetical protein